MASPTTSTSWRRPLAYLLAGGALLGVATNLAKLAGDLGLPALAFLTWSQAGAVLLLLGYTWRAGAWPRPSLAVLRYFAVAGLVSVAAPNLFLFAAIPQVGAAFGALALAFPPLLTYAGALAFGIDRFSWVKVGGVVAAIGGAVVLAVYKLSGGEVDGVWIAVVLVAPVSLAIGNLYRTARWPEGASPESLAPGMAGAGALLLLLTGGVSALGGWLSETLTLAFDVTAWRLLGLVVAQAFVFALQTVILFRLQEAGGPTYLSLLGSVGAVVGVPIAVLLLGEAWPQGLVLGGGLIGAGVLALTHER